MNHEEATGSPTRRDLLALTGTGLFVLFAATPSAAFQQSQRYPSDWNGYLRIGADGRVTCFTGKVELGQGSTTSLAQLLAEELDVDFDAIDMVMADTDLFPWDRGTVGSLGISQFGPQLRAAGAEARAVLLQMAAERLAVPVERLRVQAGMVSVAATPAHRVSYAQMVTGKRIERHVTGVPLKSGATYRIVGQSPRRKDATVKITGKAKYAADVILPGMLYARLVRPPALGVRLKSADTTAAGKLPGVLVVREGDLIAVLHEKPDLADEALALVKAEFEHPQPGPDDKTIFDHLVQNAPPLQVVAEKGNLADGEKLATAVAAERYLNSYVSHALIEPHAALVNIEGSRVNVWASAQVPYRVKQEVAQALGVPQEQVHVHPMFVGGGFGGKCSGTPPVEAARLAKLTGRPVQVVFNRAEEFLFTIMRPAAVVEIRSGLTAEGKLAFWEYKAYGGGPQESQLFYDAPHQRTVWAGSWQASVNPPGLHPLNVGVWRAPAGPTNTFARESHMDVLAARAGVDPVEFRLRHLTDKRMRRALEAAAERFGWRPAKGPSGRGVGVSCGIYTGTYMVTMAEVSVDKQTGKVKAKRVVFVHDQGRTASPEGTRQQIEGAIMMGLGYAFTEEVKFRGGEVLTRNFDTYELARYSSLPKIEIVLLDNPEAQFLGCGEPPVINLGAVMANAIFDHVGVRMLQLPMTPERVLAALKNAAARG